MKPSSPMPCGENEDAVVEAEEAGNKPKKRSRKREAIRLRWSLLVKQVSSLPLSALSGLRRELPLIGTLIQAPLHT